MPRKVDRELKARAVRVVTDHARDSVVTNGRTRIFDGLNDVAV